MEEDEFNERIARVRRRFAEALPNKLADASAAIPKLTHDGADGIETLVVTHRSLHEMCGIAPSVGYPAIGTAARAAETVLREPAKTRRPLKPEELSAFQAALDHLQQTAQADLQSTTGRG